MSGPEGQRDRLSLRKHQSDARKRVSNI
jgi:hypothetical protein